MRSVVAAAVLAGLLAGLPWALVQFVGWPLPHGVPSWAEIERTLVDPMTTTFLLDVLACACWLVWALFTLDVARYAVEIIRDARLPDVSAAGPVHRIAGVLVGAILISITGHRLGQPPAGTPVYGLRVGPEAVATAPTWTPTSDQDVGAAWLAVNAAFHQSVPAEVEQLAPSTSAVALPPDPATGEHDSLWRIAHRNLGDGSRWPEIFELNKGKPQPNGGTFTRPSLIFPGEVFALPVTAGPTTPPVAPERPPPPMKPPSTATPSTPTTPAPSAPQAPPSHRQTPPNAAARSEPGVSWGEEVFVGLGLASAVGTALVVVRRRHRRRYRPGSGDRADLPVAPVVYQLRLAHLHATQHDPDSDRQTPALPVGVRDGREIALDLAASRGLGLVGAGAAAAVRALLVTALTTTYAGACGEARVVVPAEDLAALLGHDAAQAPLPPGVHVVPNIEDALDALEAETLVRVAQNGDASGVEWRPVVVVAQAPERQRQRLQAVLDNGSSVGVTGLLLGQWVSGATAYVRDDGTISTTNPGLGEALRGTRVFQLGHNDTDDLLALLQHADPDEPAPETLAHAAERSQADADLEILDAPPASRPAHPPRSAQRTPAPSEPVSSATNDAAMPGVTNSENPADTREHHRNGSSTKSTIAPVWISVLGPPRVWWRPPAATSERDVAGREITSVFQPRVRELLVFLALHPDGASRESLIAALWPTSSPEKTTNAMNTSLSRLRRAVGTATEGTLSEVVLLGDGRYRLDPELVEVDYNRFAAAMTARRAATTDHERIDAYRHLVDSYTGPVADGLSSEWLETAREAIRRDAIDAVAALARALVDQDPQQTLDLLEVARAFDPHNELIYRDIMRLQERLGQLDAIPRTLTLLTTRLAEVDDQPTRQAVDLAERLRRRYDAVEPVRAGAGTAEPDEPRQHRQVRHRVS